MATFKLTIRDGPDVSRESFAALEQAIAALRAHADRIRSGTELEPAKAFRREYEPGDQVRARLEISTGGPLRGRDAGVDVMGDGTLVAFRGGVFRKEISAERGDEAITAVERSLRG
jgi:hypothetical protein